MCITIEAYCQNNLDVKIQLYLKQQEFSYIIISAEFKLRMYLTLNSKRIDKPNILVYVYVY